MKHDISISHGRILWLDWMKAMAILAIIWGHFFSRGHVYLYVFSVQAFCLMSGFLYKKSPDWLTCLHKCYWQLLVPTVLLSLIMHLEAYLRCMALGQAYDVSVLWYLKWLLLGHRWCMGPCWYFYTLIVMRLIMQLMPEKKWAYALLFLGLSAGAVALRGTGMVISNANVNVLVCMPMFLIGVFLKPTKPLIDRLHNVYLESGLLVVAVSLVYICGQYNGYVWMYLCDYGNHFSLYLLGGMAGTLMLFVFSKWLGRLPYRSMVQTLATGSILVIGLHIIIVRRLTELPARMWVEDMLFSLLILLAFIPVIRLAESFAPFLLGRR